MTDDRTAAWGPPPDDDLSGPMLDDGVLLPYVPPPAPDTRPSRPRAGVVAALVVGIVGLLAGAAFALVLWHGDGGSSTPEEAVRSMLDAVAAEDMIGVLEALAPAERAALQGPVEDIAGELRRLGVLDEGFDLSSLGGVDVEFEGVELQSEVVAGHLATVEVVAGTVRSTTTPGELPLGPVVDGFLSAVPADAMALEPETTVEDMSGDGVVIATVQEAGRWYVSLFYSVAEASRLDAGEPLPDFSQAVPAVGAASPAAAVEEAVRAALALDARRLVELTPPDEMRSLHEYAPLFLDDAEAAAAELRAHSEVELRLDELRLGTDSGGDTAVVTVEAFRVSGVVEGEAGSVTYDGRCFRVESSEAGAEQFCGDDQPYDPSARWLAGLEDVGLRFHTSRVGGEWYVSPTRTGLGLVVDGLRSLDSSVLEQLVQGFMGFLAPFSPESESSMEFGGGMAEIEEFEVIGEPTPFPEDAPYEDVPHDEMSPVPYVETVPPPPGD